MIILAVVVTAGKKTQNIMNRYEQEFYNDIKRIAVALEKLVRVQNSTVIIDFENEKKTKNRNKEI